MEGLNSFASYIETSEADTVYIVTNKKKSEFPNSLYPINQNSSAFDILSKTTPELLSLGNDAGTEEQWNWLNEELEKYDNWTDLVLKKFGNTSALAHNIGNLEFKTQYEQWC